MMVVTGAFGFAGRYIARRLLMEGEDVTTLTAHPQHAGLLDGKIKALPYNFDNPTALVESLKGVEVLFNTYWIRFARGPMTFDKAIANSRILIDAAREAGVKRLVHISITNPSLKSDLPYFRGKALVEKAIMESGLSYAILRPAVLFGEEGILLNNIAHFLRHYPVFAIPGSGNYRLQPIFVEDLADLTVLASKSKDNLIVDALGPESFTFNQVVDMLAKAADGKARIMHLPPPLVLAFTSILGKIVGDVVLTPDEIKGLQQNLLVSTQKPTGTKGLRVWIEQNGYWLGKQYMSELKRHY